MPISRESKTAIRSRVEDLERKKRIMQKDLVSINAKRDKINGAISKINSTLTKMKADISG